MATHRARQSPRLTAAKGGSDANPVLPGVAFSGTGGWEAEIRTSRGEGIAASTLSADNPVAPRVGAARPGITQCGLFPTPYKR